MPQLTDSERTGDFGEDYVSQIVKFGWRCLYVPQIKDRYAVDAIILDVLDGRVQPLQFNVQIKARAFNCASSKSIAAPVMQNHLDLWRQLNVPVLLVCVDTLPPTRAYWHVIGESDELPLHISTRKIFGPGSRDAVVAAVRRALRQDSTRALTGTLLDVPLNEGLRQNAKAYYRRLKGETHAHATYGPIRFSWKGWRHITRRKRSAHRIASTLSLLPSLPAIIRSAVQPIHARELLGLHSQGALVSRTLLIFELTLRLKHRSDARVRLVLERETTFPIDWAVTDPVRNPPKQQCKFLSFSELPCSV